MRYWVLKGRRRSEFGFENDFARLLRGRGSTWHSAKMLDQVSPGDRLFVYEGAPRFEVWGLAEYVRRIDDANFRIRHQTGPLAHRAGRDRDGWRTLRVLARSSFLKPGDVRTLYPLTPVEARALLQSVASHEPSVRRIWSSLAPMATPPARSPSHAISIRQPFVEQIMLGIKRHEYRSVATRLRGTVYVYASLTLRDEAHEWRKANLRPSDAVTGRIVGTVEIVDCLRRGPQDFAYVLANPKRLARPKVARNQPQPVFWRPVF